MQVVRQDTGVPLRGDLLTRVVLRTDLTPIPSTVEVEAIRSTEVEAAFQQDKGLLIGASGIPFKIIKVHMPIDSGMTRGDRQVGTIKATGILASCAAVAKPLQRSVIREGASLGAIYRACGASVSIASDFTVQSFSAFIGQTPTYCLAQVLQEEGGVLMVDSQGRVAFRRLDELRASKAQYSVNDAAAPIIVSDFLERHIVPFGISTDSSGAITKGRSESGRSMVYRPRATTSILNNISTTLIQRRKMPFRFAPEINAGSRIDVGATPNIVITAAHVFDGKSAGGSFYSQFWLGEVVN